MRAAPVFVLIVSSAAFADEAKPLPCPAAVTAGRRDAEKKLKAGDTAGALASLEALKARCGDQIDTASALWLVSDMAFAAHSAGKDDRCAELISSVDDEAASANPKVAKALLYNARLCKPKEDCDYKLDQDEPVCKMELAVAYGERSALGGFAPACPLKNHEKGVALGDGSCLEAGAWRRKGKEEDMDATCPVLYRIDAKGTAEGASCPPVG